MAAAAAVGRNPRQHDLDVAAPRAHYLLQADAQLGRPGDGTQHADFASLGCWCWGAAGSTVAIKETSKLPTTLPRRSKGPTSLLKPPPPHRALPRTLPTTHC